MSRSRHEPPIDNKSAFDALLWSLFSFVLPLAAFGYGRS
jgi:hypothetical protein